MLLISMTFVAESNKQVIYASLFTDNACWTQGILGKN